MSNIDNTQETKPMEKVVFSWSDNRLVGIAFLMSMPLIFLMRFRIGIRILRADMAVALMVCLSLIAHLSDWISGLPLIGSSRQMDFAAWKLFIFGFGVMFIIHLVRAFQEAKQKKPYTYTRSLGNSWLWKLFKNSPLPFIKKELDFQIFLEPVISLVASIILGEMVAPNLGTFLSLSSICLFVVGWQIRSNLLTVKHDANDASIISDVVVQSESEPSSDVAQVATGATGTNSSSSSKQDDVYI